MVVDQPLRRTIKDSSRTGNESAVQEPRFRRQEMVLLHGIGNLLYRKWTCCQAALSGLLRQEETQLRFFLSFLVPVFTGSDDFDELKEIRLQSYLRPRQLERCRSGP